MKLQSTQELTFGEFVKQESMQELLLSLRGSKHKHTKPKSKLNLHSTQLVYANRLYHLHKWLNGRNFEFNNFIHTGENTFKNVRENVILNGLEHFLKLYQDSFNSRRDFVRLLKKYLNDSLHSGKYASTMTVEKSAILAYFKHNETEIEIPFNPKTRYKVKDESDELPELSLEELLKLLTLGRPTLVQKAMILCKFHRGLDTATLTDRFNFEAWRQLVDYFGTELYMNWDLTKCPVPIKLTRMKTDFTHTGFLDRDAIVSIQNYLEDEEKKKGRKMLEGKPLFVNQKDNPINIHWVSRAFNRMAEKSGIQSKLDGYKYKTKFSKDSHELRDLLESTLLDCSVRSDVVEHVTGHKPKDSYEKQASLYPNSLRAEFMKASKRLNIFSNMSYYMKGREETDALQRQIDGLKQQLSTSIEKDKLIEKVAIRTEDQNKTINMLVRKLQDLESKYTDLMVENELKKIEELEDNS